MPTGVQLHVGLTTVPTDRVSSALNHLLEKDRKTPIKGVASVLLPSTVDEQGVAAAAEGGADAVCIVVSDAAQGLAAVQAASNLSMGSRVLLSPNLCEDAHDVQLHAANLGDAGAEAILLSLDAAIGEDELRELVDMACEVDLLGVPMRSRLGLSVRPGADGLKLAAMAYKQNDLLHHVSCLAGKANPKPSELLEALGVRKTDANFGKLFLAEFVPDAA